MKYVAPINLPNFVVSNGVKKTMQDTGKTLTGSTQIVTNVIEKIAIKNPTWKFVVSKGRYATDKELASDTFQVFCGKEQLGDISIGYHHNKEAVTISNPRVGKEMQRYNGRTTTKEAVAIKHVEKYFYAKTTDENIEVNFQEAFGAIDAIERQLRNKTHEAHELVNDKMMHFVMSRWDDFVVEENVCSRGKEYPSLKREWNKIKAIDANKSMATVIMLLGKEYVMRKDGVITKGSELNEELKTKVGMLKLLDDEVSNPNLGIKVNSNLFVLF